MIPASLCRCSPRSHADTSSQTTPQVIPSEKWHKSLINICRRTVLIHMELHGKLYAARLQGTQLTHRPFLEFLSTHMWSPQIKFHTQEKDTDNVQDTRHIAEWGTVWYPLSSNGTDIYSDCVCNMHGTIPRWIQRRDRIYWQPTVCPANSCPPDHRNSFVCQAMIDGIGVMVFAYTMAINSCQHSADVWICGMGSRS